MNTILKLLATAGAAGILYKFLLKKKAALENLEIRSIDVYIDKEKTRNNYFLKLFYNVKLTLYNKETVNINIKSIDARFYLNGIKFGSLQNNVNTTIAPGATKELNLQTSINSSSVITSILDIISENKAGITVVGSILTDLGLIEFKESKLV